MGRGLAALAALMLALFAAPAIAGACGMPINASVEAERALIVFGAGRQDLITALDLSLDGPEAAVLFPLPAPPEVDQPAGGEALFGYLAEVTRPLEDRRRRFVWRESEGMLVGGAPPGVNVLGRETIGGYDVARLAADDPAALGAWLADNGFRVPAAAEPVIADYIADGWSFVAIKLALDAPGASLAPLRFSFPSERLVFPVRFDSLSPEPVALDIYVAADWRVDMPPLMTRFAGRVDDLDAQPPPDVAAILGDAPFLTRLSAERLAPNAMAEDFVGRQSRNGEPYRETVTVYEDVYVFREYGAILLALGGLAFLSVLAIAGALLLRRRIDSVGDRKP